ncbi:MAG: Stp1/IreP family PP2C-type Ser/Thr phosphatase [Gemmatimonadales bacterium]
MTTSPPPVSVTVRARSDPGQTRDHNEDVFRIADLSGGKDLANGGPHRVGDRGSVFLVADGMGGAAAGELASSMAAQFIVTYLTEHWSRDGARSPELFTERLREAVEQANDRLHAYAQEHPDVRGMGTTATVAGVLDGALYLAQVGDSRGYLIRNGVATQLTKDQSLMQRLVDAGELTEEEAAQSERRNIILQALGPDPRIRVDLTRTELQRGDTLVICSDGLSGQVKREEIATLVEEVPDLDQVCDRLVALANERGGPDNITVVAVRFDGDGLRTAAASAPDNPQSDLPRRGDEPPNAEPSNPEPPSGKPEALIHQSEETSGPPAAPARRSGSPAVIAVVTVVVLAVLLLVYLVLRR